MSGGYKAKSGAKAERKLGLKAVANLNNDPNWPRDKILATAKQHEKTFSDIDEYDDALFCDTMSKMRSQKPDLYAVFWWWRLAHEHSAKTAEDEGEAKPETRYRTFMVTQFLAPPFSDQWEDDRRTLKSGAMPLITDEIILDGLDHRTIKRWAYVWHDRDVYTEEDEITDRDQLRKAGERKFKHVHVMLDIPAKVPVSTVARWFGVPPQQVDIMRGRGAFLDGVEYLVHESPRAVEQHKTQYDDDEVYASEGFDFRKELNDLQAHRLKYGRRAGEMTPSDTLQAHVLDDGWTLRQCRESDPLSYIKVRNSLPGFRLDYLQDHVEPCPFRMNIYIDGPGSVGKSAFSEYLAETMFPNYDHPYFAIGGDDRVTFDGYDGEPCIIWDDMRVTDFIKQFGSNGTYRILDLHPKKIAQQAKHSRVILTNQLNIINGIQPYDEFIEGLAGTYRDKYGVQHEAEDENQAWRRFPMIICLREEDFDVLINQGFVNHDLRSIKTMQMFAHVRGSMKAVQERLSGAAKDQILLTFGKPVLEAKKVIDDSHEEKISDPALIPAEFADYGTVETGPEYEARIAREKEAAAEAAAKKKVKRYQRALSDFGHWFWYYSTAFRDAWHDYPTLVMDDHQDDRLRYLRGLTRFCIDENDPDSEMPVIDVEDENDAVPMLSKLELIDAFEQYLYFKDLTSRDSLLNFWDDVGPLVDALLAGLAGRTAGVTNKDYEMRMRKHAEDVETAVSIKRNLDYKKAIESTVELSDDSECEKDEDADAPHVYEGPNSTDRNY